jgi:hypothetical protein
MIFLFEAETSRFIRRFVPLFVSIFFAEPQQKTIFTAIRAKLEVLNF